MLFFFNYNMCLELCKHFLQVVFMLYSLNMSKFFSKGIEKCKICGHKLGVFRFFEFDVNIKNILFESKKYLLLDVILHL